MNKKFKEELWFGFVLAIFTGILLLVAYAREARGAAPLPIRPDATLTPGVVNPEATKAVICVKGYTAQPGIRNVSVATKQKVFAEYKLNPADSRFEIDHLISLELGGANDIKNLWPQSYDTVPLNAHTKDVLENKLHALVCSDKADLAQVQKDIAKDWTAAYVKYVGPLPTR